MDRCEHAVELKHKGYNCAQAVLCKDLKGRDTGTVICECDDCVRNAVRISEGT